MKTNGHALLTKRQSVFFSSLFERVRGRLLSVFEALKVLVSRSRCPLGQKSLAMSSPGSGGDAGGEAPREMVRH